MHINTPKVTVHKAGQKMIPMMTVTTTLDPLKTYGPKRRFMKVSASY